MSAAPEHIASHLIMPNTIVMYMSLVRHGPAGWQSGPSGEDLAFVESALRSYKSIDAARIYSVMVPVVAIGDGANT